MIVVVVVDGRRGGLFVGRRCCCCRGHFLRGHTLGDIRGRGSICVVFLRSYKGVLDGRGWNQVGDTGSGGPKPSVGPFRTFKATVRRGGATFSIESAREGIGDRNIMEEEDTEETEIQTPPGPMDFIFRRRGREGLRKGFRGNGGGEGKREGEKSKKARSNQFLAGNKGFSGTGIWVGGFWRTVKSLNQIGEGRAGRPRAAQISALKFHRKVLGRINGGSRIRKARW